MITIGKPIDFKHYYYKLDNEEFTTIRGKASYNAYQIGEFKKITLNRNHFCIIQIINKELRKINDLPLDFLKKDAEFPGFIINSHYDFVDLLNSFLPDFYTKSTIHSEKTILYLRKVYEK